MVSESSSSCACVEVFALLQFESDTLQNSTGTVRLINQLTVFVLLILALQKSADTAARFGLHNDFVRFGWSTGLDF